MASINVERLLAMQPGEHIVTTPLIGDTQRGRRESDTVVMHNKFTEPLMAGEHLFRRLSQYSPISPLAMKDSMPVVSKKGPIPARPIVRAHTILPGPASVDGRIHLRARTVKTQPGTTISLCRSNACVRCRQNDIRTDVRLSYQGHPSGGLRIVARLHLD